MLGKLDIYRKFTNALAVTVIVSVGWICYEVISFRQLRLIYLFHVLWNFEYKQ